MLMLTKRNIKGPARTVGITVSICVVSTSMLVIFGNVPYILMNPFLKGYLHLSISHFSLNVLMLFVTLLAGVNRSYGFKNIYIITLLIFLIHLPLEMTGISQTALGLSGTCYFLLSRYFFSWKERSLLGVFIIGILALLELGASINMRDEGTAHSVHIIGIVLGYLSIRYQHKKSLKKLGF